MNPTQKTEAPEVAFVQRVLQEGLTQGASHIHVEPVDDDVAVRYRVGRDYRDYARETRDISTVMTQLRTLAGLSVVPPFGPEWGVIKFENGEKVHRFAAQMLPSLTGEKAVLQLLRETYMDPRRLDELGLLDDQLATLKSNLEQRSGVVVLCGPTGSGLDTTAYASLLRLDRGARSVASIEMVAQGQVPGVHRMEAGDVDEKNAMLRALIRTDTDVVYLQDLSGGESAALALSAAIEHQKLVIASLHSISAAAAVTHFVNMSTWDRALARGERNQSDSGSATTSPALPRMSGACGGARRIPNRPGIRAERARVFRLSSGRGVRRLSGCWLHGRKNSRV